MEGWCGHWKRGGCLCTLCCFFFSSRRRHTRCSRDWSSDVCSSDLLFPNVEAPVGHDSDFYSVYFSRGVLLEAQLIARELAETREPIHTLVQVFRSGDVGEQAARTLQAARTDAGQEVVNRVLKAHAASKDLAAALREVGPRDALVLWLRPGDLSALEKVPPPTSRVWISGEMGGLEQAPLPAGWREGTRMAHPVGLPGRREDPPGRAGARPRRSRR